MYLMQLWKKLLRGLVFIWPLCTRL